MSDFLLEVTEELRAKQIKAFFNQYGQWLIGLALLVVIGTAIGSFWHSHKNAVLERDTDAMAKVLQQTEADPKAIEKQLNDLKVAAPLDMVGDLYLAQKHEQAGNLQAAQDTYKKLIKRSGTPHIIDDLARLHATRLGLALDQKPDDLLSLIEPLTKDANAYRGSALELKGLVLRKQGKNDEANKIFESLSTDGAVPNTLRIRAKSLIQYEMKDAAQ